MPAPLPDTVKATLSELTSAQQVVLRGYIATLREQIKEFEEKALAASDPDPLSHYHGHEKCTVDHEHGSTAHEHGETHAHGHKESHEHHHMEHESSCGLDHNHSGHTHDHEHHKEPADGHSHGHDHHGECKHESHDHDKHHHGHKHSHDNQSGHDHDHHHHHDDEEHMPAWKKKALEAGNSDPMAAPFGGDWTTESSLAATEDTMQE